ncbi:MAG: hypothetical protein GY795_30585 [Desulfobacterales bacterium]|nr:hypothetical protein [Desulfobacterales bacterium]
MKQDKKYQKIEKELDKIILAEIQSRLNEKRKKLSVSNINDLIENKNREIVEAHQKGIIDSKIPALFSAYLQTKENGRLYAEEKNLRKTEFDAYTEKKDRFEVLFSASVNALGESVLKYITDDKIRMFDDMYQKTKKAMNLAGEARDIEKKADDAESAIPRDEEAAVSYLTGISPLKAQLQEISSQYIELKHDNCLTEALEQLQSAIHLASKRISSKSRRASKFIFNQAGAVFDNYKSTKPDISNVQLFISQKEELARYCNLFDSIGDENKKKQAEAFISTIDAALESLQKDIEKQKQHEAEISEKDNRKIKNAYEQFLDIKEMYSQGMVDTGAKQKKAVQKLKKSCDILKSNGQRVKAREIERFLNSTGIDKPETPDTLQEQNMFYKKAFLAILPVTIGLALITVYFMLFH